MVVQQCLICLAILNRESVKVCEGVAGVERDVLCERCEGAILWPVDMDVDQALAALEKLEAESQVVEDRELIAA